MGVVGRLDQYASMLAYEFDETTANGPSITGLGTYYASEFSENVGIATTMTANIFPPYDLVYDEFAGVLYGPGQGRYMRQNTDKSVIVYNEINEIGLLPTDPVSTSSTVNFSYTGASQTFTVPANIYWLRVTANGAGGGKGSGTQNGGSGGRVVGWVPVEPGQIYKVIVGQGGIGKGSLAVSRYGGGGGGFSGLLNNSTDTHIISAGGGGGGQTNTPITTGNTILSISGGHTIVYNTTSPAGGAGGSANSSFSSAAHLIGASGTSSGGGNGGTTWTGSTIVDAGGGGGGGGYGTGVGIGGSGNDGSDLSNNTAGKGGDGGFGGGGGGGGGGYGGNTERTNPGGGGGGGYIGGQGGINNPTYLHRGGQGGYNFLYWNSNPRGGSTTPLVSTTSGGGSAGATVSGNTGTNGLITIEY